MSHFNKICEFGKSHGQCRCPSENKVTHLVPCDRPDEHRPEQASVLDDLKEAAEQVPYERTLHARMEKTVEGFFGNIIMPKVKDALVEMLEKDVWQWLIDKEEGLK